MLNDSLNAHRSAAVTFLKYLESKSDCAIFLTPVDWQALKLFDYPKIIDTPMDFSTIRKKLESNTYGSITELLDDVQLIYANCKLYNEEGSDIYKMSERMEECTKAEVKKRFGADLKYGQKSNSWKELNSQRLDLQEFDE